MFNCKLKYVMFSLLCVFISPFIVKADCSYEREAELSRIASNIQISYTYELKNGIMNYLVNITNITDDVFVFDNYGNKFTVGDHVKNYISVSELSFDVYSMQAECMHEKILTKHLTLPIFNQFSILPECEKYPNFRLCTLWLDTSKYSKSDFESALNKYNDDLLNNKEIEEEKKWFEIVWNLLTNEDNFIYFILTIVGILFLIIYFIVKKVRYE